MTTSVLYLYADESGNFDFSPGGTKYFVMTCIAISRPFPAHDKLLDVRYDHLESGLDLQHFHASEDRQAVRDRVFGAIAEEMTRYRAFTVLIRKNRAEPHLRAPEALYPALKPLIPTDKRYYLYHHQSRSDINLQVADYFGWAVYRKWERDDTRSYNLVSPVIMTESELFAGGGEEYY